jgi:hypothetical protein
LLQPANGPVSIMLHRFQVTPSKDVAHPAFEGEGVKPNPWSTKPTTTSLPE